jgi:hypothetical protein
MKLFLRAAVAPTGLFRELQLLERERDLLVEQKALRAEVTLVTATLNQSLSAGSCMILLQRVSPVAPTGLDTHLM